MKTEDLIKLKESITQGEWKRFDSSLVTSVSDGHTDHIAQITNRAERIHNATAISLVPQLLSEVIKLREALSASLSEHVEVDGFLSERLKDGEPVSAWKRDTEQVIATIRAAISKATGDA